MEMYSVGRNNCAFYYCLSSYLKFHNDSSIFSQNTLKPIIESSLMLTIKKHPRLRFQVDQDIQPPKFIILPLSVFDQLPISYVKRENDDTVREILENENNKPFQFNEQTPLWRIIIVASEISSDFEIIVSFHHVICDGISSMIFFQTFVKYLNDCQTISSDDFPLLDLYLEQDQALDQICIGKLPSLSSILLKLIEKLFIPHILHSYLFPKTYWTGNVQLTGVESNKTCLLSFMLDSNKLNLLYLQCKQNQTTVHAALVASILLAIIEFNQHENLELLCGSAISMRKYCQPIISDNQLGIFISSANTCHFLNSSSIPNFWLLAQNVKQQLNEQILNEALPIVKLMKFVRNWNEYVLEERKRLPNGKQASISLSNVLQWNFADININNSKWKIVNGGFTQSADIIGGIFSVNAMTVNGTLNIYISYQQSNVKQPVDALCIRDNMKKWLETAANGNV
ncbi:unnamed protein product [Didymodactylos carnosus]|uniref:Alcohol acetyltransferase n=1 Tax=Didymodactylos carnosus TaxID=1234261 RepID=A0A8S2J4Z9_9BILA|nr:unnamed protein product [Didymodactylos carnosus]CAF3780778.1 unnamed protein product [Didymodactylos carnosus]